MQVLSKPQQDFSKHKSANSKIYMERYRLTIVLNTLTNNKMDEITLSNGKS